MTRSVYLYVTLLGALLGACDKASVTSKEGQGQGPALGRNDAGNANLPDLGVALVDGAPADLPPVSAPPEGEACARETRTAQLVPVDLLLLLDASGSMTTLAGTRSRWELAREGLQAFFKDGRSAGLGVGLQMFPLHTRTCDDDGTCFLPAPGGCRVFSACLPPGAQLVSGSACGSNGDDPCPAGTTCTPLGRCSVSGDDCLTIGQPCPSGMAGDTCAARPRQCRLGPASRGSCVVADYQKVAVPIAELGTVAARLTGAIDGRLPLGGTPLGPAVKGALGYLRPRLQSAPERRAALVIVTDGVPEGCGDLPSIVADLAGASMGMPAISSYVVAVFADTDPPEARATVAQLATAGGTGMPFLISANDQLADKLLGALNQIRGAALSCDLAIPATTSGPIDYGRVKVQVTGGGGLRDLVYVASADRCGATAEGWYYDRPPASGVPSRVQLCPAACDKLKADPKGSIELVFGCRPRTVD